MESNTWEEDIANYREDVAGQISDMGIWRSVVRNVVEMDSSLTDKIDILLNAVPDLGIIITQLSLCRSSGLLVREDYDHLVNQCMLSVQQKQDMKFDPNLMNDLSNGA